MASNLTLYFGWRDLGPKRNGRAWQTVATTDRSTLVRPPWSIIVRAA